MEPVSTFEQVLQQEKQVVAQKLRQQLEQLRPGLLELLHNSGFKLYSLEGKLYIRRGVYQATLTIAQLEVAGRASQAALLELIKTSVLNEGELRNNRFIFFVVLMLWLMFVGGYFLVGLPGPLILCTSLIPLGTAADAWAQLRAYWPWKLLYHTNLSSHYIPLFSVQE